MLLEVNRHGGRCCGIRHLRDFGNYSPTNGSREDFILKSVDQVVKSFVPDYNSSSRIVCTCTQCTQARENNTPEKVAKKQKDWITAVECVLAGNQYETWKEPLEKCGFKEVFSFKNSNSSNMCHVFYGTTNPVVEDANRREVSKDVESAPQDTEIAV